MIPLKPGRKAQLEEYAKRRDRAHVATLDDALAAYFEWER
jgi:predicted transcriptional regulator